MEYCSFKWDCAMLIHYFCSSFSIFPPAIFSKESGLFKHLEDRRYRPTENGVLQQSSFNLLMKKISLYNYKQSSLNVYTVWGSHSRCLSVKGNVCRCAHSQCGLGSVKHPQCILDDDANFSYFGLFLSFLFKYESEKVRKNRQRLF